MSREFFSTFLLLLFTFKFQGQTFIPLDSAKISGTPQYYDSMGDTWVTAWGNNDTLFIAWGDGTGLTNKFPSFNPSADSCKVLGSPQNYWQIPWCALAWNDCSANSYCPTDITDCGIGLATGNIPMLSLQNIKAHVPGDTPWIDTLGNEVSRNDKPTCLIYFNDTLFGTFHTKKDVPDTNIHTYSDTGYVAFSTDKGQTWTHLIATTPWKKNAPAGLEKLTVLMWANEGQGFSDDTDGYLYGFGIGKEFFWTHLQVYLTRVNKHRITDYSAYEYLVGMSGSTPVFKQLSAFSPSDTLIAVPGLYMIYKGSVMYHKPTHSYLFMTNSLDGELDLWQAREPWGPWNHVSTLINVDGQDIYGNPLPNFIPVGWSGDGYVPGLIPKQAGLDSLFFTISNVGGGAYYQLIIGKLKLYSSTGVKLIQHFPKVQLFPNPASKNLKITSELPVTSVSLYNSLGEKVFYQNFSTPTLSPFLTFNLPHGVYQVKLTYTDNSSQTVRLIIRRP